MSQSTQQANRAAVALVAQQQLRHLDTLVYRAGAPTTAAAAPVRVQGCQQRAVRVVSLNKCTADVVQPEVHTHNVTVCAKCHTCVDTAAREGRH